MTRKQKRLTFVILLVAVPLTAICYALLYIMPQTVSFFRTPSEIVEHQVPIDTRIKLGGMVERGSVKKGPGTIVNFVVTDTLKSVTVSYNGILPDLFSEGQGVVTEGKLQSDGTFVADTVLAKHDEKYMPRELADSLRKQGVQLPEGRVQE